MTNWPVTILGELLNVKHGFAFPGAGFGADPSDPVVLTPGNFAIGGGFVETKLKTYRGPYPSEYLLRPNSLIVTMTDLSKQGDTLGFSARTPRHGRYLHNQRIGLVEITRPEALDVDFAYLLLQTPLYRQHVLATATGSTVRHTSPSRIGTFHFPRPPLDEQRRIAGVLGALDDLIELNGKLIVDLTELALKRSIGPSAAEYRPLAELYEVGLSGVWGEEAASATASQRVAVLRGKDLEEIVSGKAASPPYRFLSQKQIASRTPEFGEIWTAGSGSLGPSLPITKELSDTVGWPTVLYSNFVKRLVPLAESDWYGVAWGAMIRAWKAGHFANFKTGTAMPNLDPAAMLKGIEVPALEADERAEVNRLASQALGPELRHEIAQLRRTRDELLPLLMSGAVRVRPEGVAA